MSEHEHDVIIIGSGLSALHAALPLVEAGLDVAMLDAGFDEADILEKGVPQTFDNIRKFDPAQHKIFFGDDLSGIRNLLDSRTHASGTMTAGRRAYVVRYASEHQPLKSKDASVIQSLASGGLSGVWGAVCATFSETEFVDMGLPSENMDRYYQAVIDNIGVSGQSSKFRLQPPSRLDINSKRILEKYEKSDKKATKPDFILEQPMLALLTQPIDDREATSYRDMDYWDNIGRNVYRGHYTLEVLKKSPNFTYIPNSLVSKVQTDALDISRISFRKLDGSSGSAGASEISARAVVLGAGAVNTTRILLRSFELYDIPTPIIMKTNYTLPCLLPFALGQNSDRDAHSLCQLLIHGGTDGYLAGTFAQMYSYKSLLLSKLLRYVPMPAPEAMSVLARIVPSLMIADVRFDSVMNMKHNAILRRSGAGSGTEGGGDKDGDYLEINYPDIGDRKKEETKLVQLKRALRNLGLIPLKTVKNPYGSSSHYAGGVPVVSEKSMSARKLPLWSDAFGRVNNSKRIFVADSSSWRALPAKPLGLTLMANARRIGEGLRDMILSNEI